MAIPTWLRWLVSPDSRAERAGRRLVIPTKEVTEEDVQSAVAAFKTSVARALLTAASTIDRVRLRKFIEELPSAPPAPPTDVPVWRPTAEVLDLALPGRRKEHS